MASIGNTFRRLERINEKLLQVSVQQWISILCRQIKDALLEQKFEKSFASELTDWEFVQRQGVTTLKPAAIKIIESGGIAAYKYLAIEGSFDVLNIQAVKAVNKFCSKLVKEVTKGTKKSINSYVRYGIEQGWSMPKVAKELRPLVGLTSKQTMAVINRRTMLTETQPDLTAAQLDKAVQKYANKLHRQRTLNIARTETARAQNIGYCQGLGEVGVKQVELRIGPKPCDECRALDGTKYPVDEAEGIIPVHPRCTCVMLPVIEGTVITDTLREPPEALSES